MLYRIHGSKGNLSSVYREDKKYQQRQKSSDGVLDDFHSSVSGAILSAYLKADGGYIDKMQ